MTQFIPQSHKLPATELTCVQPTLFDGTEFTAAFYDTYEFQIFAAVGGPWTPYRSFDGTKWDPCYVQDQNDQKFTSITTDDVSTIFRVRGRIKFMLKPTNDADMINAMIRAS